MQIVFKNKDFIIVNKPAGIPSQSDLTNDDDAMTLTSAKLRKLGEGSELWLIHRLDRVVGGLLVFARNKKSAAILSSLAASGGLEKRYIAALEGEAEGGLLNDFIYKDSTSLKAYVTDRKRAGVKEARLEYKPLSFALGKTLVHIDLITGRFHQIRVQFSSRKMPLVGDKKYGSRDSVSKNPALFACRLGFDFKGEHYEFKALPDTDKYPWNLFENKIYEEI